MDPQHIIEKWKPVLEMAGCPEARIEKLAMYAEDAMLKEMHNSISTQITDTTPLLPINIRLLSRLSVDESNFIFSGLAKRTVKTARIQISRTLINEHFIIEDFIYNEVFKLVSELTQEEIEKTKTFHFSGNIINKIALITEDRNSPVIEVTYNSYSA